jgi:hypothetical protein
MVELAKKEAQDSDDIEFRIGNMLELKLDDSSVAAMFNGCCIPHVDFDGVKTTLSEAARVLMRDLYTCICFVYFCFSFGLEMMLPCTNYYNDDEDGRNDDEYTGDMASLETYINKWNDAFDIFKYCQPCRAYNLGWNTDLTEGKDREGGQGEDRSVISLALSNGILKRNDSD